MYATSAAVLPAVGAAVSGRAPFGRYAMAFLYGGPPGSPLQIIKAEDTGSISVSVEHYDLIGAVWQSVFFTNSTTPIVFADYEALWSAVSAVPEFNNSNVTGTYDKWVAIYVDGGAFPYTFPFVLG